MTTETTTQTSTTDAAPTEAELDALFDELSARGSQTADEKPEAETPATDETPAAAADPLGDGQPADRKETAPAAATTTATQPPAKADEPKPVDIDSLPVDLQEWARKLENERRAAVGRAAALQREHENLKRRATAAPATAAATGAKDSLKDEFPELDAAMSARLKATEQQLRQEIDAKTVLAKSEALEAFHPGWQKTMTGPEFNYWLTQQPAEVQRLIDSDSVRDYATLLRSFDAQTKAPATQQAQPSQVERIQAQRDARLQTATAVPQSRRTTNPTTEPDAETDPDGYFNYLSRRRDQQTARR